MKLTDLENISILVSLYSLLFATICFVLKQSIFTIPLMKKSADIFLYISNISISILMIDRWFVSKHFPLSNLYESTIFLAWSLTLVYFLLNKQNNDWLGLIIAPSAMLIYGFAILGLPKEMQEIKVLIPALQSYWLMMHVSMMILSYASLLCGCLFSMTLLVVKYEKILSQISSANNILSIDLIISTKEVYNSSFFLIENNLQSLCFYKKAKDLIKELDYWSFKTISVGFPFLTIGIVSGAVWANEAWGSYWSWDPKETWALITWLIFAIYLHIRITKDWKTEISAIVASFGFIVIWLCYLGVNLLGTGLHSYGWFN